MKCGLCLLLFLLPTLALARLGETEAQLTARFGPAVSRAKETTIAQGKFVEFGLKLTYRQNDWQIECALIDGRSARETYYKPGEWTDDQFTTVLTANGQGARWTDLSKELTRKLARDWRRADGATASWKMTGSLCVTHPAYVRAKDLAEAKAKAAASRLPKI